MAEVILACEDGKEVGLALLFLSSFMWIYRLCKCFIIKRIGHICPKVNNVFAIDLYAGKERYENKAWNN